MSSITRITDADYLSGPSDMVGLLKHLTKIIRDVEAMPGAARQIFWDETVGILETTPVEDTQLDGIISERSMATIYGFLATMCGPKLTEITNGATREYHDSFFSHAKEQINKITHSPWDAFLDREIDKAPNRKKGMAVLVRLIGALDLTGTLRRADDDPDVLKMTRINGTEIFFLSKDIVTIETCP